MGRLSEHFVEDEFACRHCGVARAHPALVDGLERLRELAYPSGLIVRSGYRCDDHNTAAGGAQLSQHQYGAAADVDLRAELDAVRALGVFSGIGYQVLGGRRLVRHVDVRHAGPHNWTSSTPARPALWRY
jgi:uncharacterized protein YcbK (DUF882 family)